MCGGTRTHNLSLGGNRRNRTSETLIKSQLPYHSAMLPYCGDPNHDFSLNSHLPAHTHDGRRVSTLAPTEGLEPSDHGWQRFSRPFRYQLRYKSACSRIYWASAGGPSFLFYAPIQRGEIGRLSP